MPEKTEKKKSGKEALNPKQRYFCELYASDTEFFGHGTNSYTEAYDPPRVGNWIKSSMASASRLLRNVNALLYINELLEEKGLNDTFVDKQLLFIITQHADFKSKLGGIKEYNLLKSRIKNRLELGLPESIGEVKLTLVKNEDSKPKDNKGVPEKPRGIPKKEIQDPNKRGGGREAQRRCPWLN